MDIDVHDQPEGDHHGQHRGAAVGDQRQRHADHRHQPHHHGDVDEDVEEDRAGQAERQQPAEMVAAAQRDGEAVAEDDHVDEDHPEPAQQAELLGQHGEDEVGLLLGQEVEVALRALQEAAAGDAAGAERDLRLQDVVAGAQRVAVRVEEGQHAALLVVVQQELPGQRDRGEAEDAAERELPHAHPGDEEHHDAADHQHAGGAEVRLLEHQRDRRKHHRGRNQQVDDAADILVADRMEVAGQRQHHADLHHLRGLQQKELEVDPAPRAHAHGAGNLDADQQGQRNAVDDIGVLQPDPQVRDRDEDQRRHADGEADRLALGPRIHAAAGGRV